MLKNKRLAPYPEIISSKAFAGYEYQPGMIKFAAIMKNLKYITLSAFVLLTACKDQMPENNQVKQIKEIVKTQPAGTIIAADSMRFTEDKLNDFYFAVKVTTTEHSDKGTYAVEASVGPKEAASKFTMPRGGEEVVPVLKKGDEPFSYIIGFYYNNDTTFYDYYKIAADASTIQMKYTKAYAIK